MQPPLESPHIRKLKPYVPGKPVEEVQRELGITDIIKLASNENPLGPSPRALEAIRESLDRIAHYPDGSCFELSCALADHWGVGRDEVMVGNGSDELIHYLGLAYLRPGDQVLTSEPTFVRYEAAALLGEAEYLAVPSRDLGYDLDAMAQEIGPATRIVFIANPNNPTGTMLGSGELRRFLDRCPESVLVVLDEAYHEYVDDPDYPDGIQFVAEGRNVVVLRTFSKIYALAALRVGYGIARPEIVAAVNQVREPFNVNSLAQAAALASLRDASQVTRSREANTSGKQYLYREFRRLGLDFVATQANFVLVNVGRSGDEVFRALLHRGVIIRSGEQLGLSDFIRVTIGTPEQNSRFIRELEAVLTAS